MIVYCFPIGVVVVILGYSKVLIGGYDKISAQCGWVG